MDRAVIKTVMSTESTRYRSPSSLLSFEADDSGSPINNLADRLKSKLVIDDCDIRSADCGENYDHLSRSKLLASAARNVEFRTPGDGSHDPGAMVNTVHNNVIESHARPRDILLLVNVTIEHVCIIFLTFVLYQFAVNISVQVIKLSTSGLIETESPRYRKENAEIHLFPIFLFILPPYIHVFTCLFI